MGTKENLTFTIFAVKVTVTLSNFNSSQYYYAMLRQFYISLFQFLTTNTVIQTAFAITTEYSLISNKHPVILTAYVVIYNEFQKCDVCRSVIKKLYNIYNFILPRSG